MHISWARLASFCHIGFISDPLIVSKFHNKTHDPKGQENKIYTIVKGRETFYRRHTIPVTSCSEVKYVLKRVSFGSKNCTRELKLECARELKLECVSESLRSVVRSAPQEVWESTFKKFNACKHLALRYSIWGIKLSFLSNKMPRNLDSSTTGIDDPYKCKTGSSCCLRN